MDGDTTVTAVTEVEVGRGPPRGVVLLGKYRVESTLGFGGMGLVIKAHNLALDEHVAIKLLREDIDFAEENVERFVREAKNAVRLKSEHVARIRDVGTFPEDGRPYMVMELLEGLDLGKLLVDVGAIDRARAVDLVLQACDAIAEAHSLGIVHRDIKPTNLFVTRRRDGSELLKVLDFGIAKAQMGPELSLTQTSSMLGTPAYMSPEQMRSARTVDPRSDIWSLGCVLYELVEGHPPFQAENFAELCVMVAIEPFTPLRAAPELAPVIEGALAKAIEDRFQDVTGFAQALVPYASEPERAQRQVARIARMLGRASTNNILREPTPLAVPVPARDSASSIGSLAHGQIPSVRSGAQSLWKALLFLAALAGLGVVTGLLVMSSSSEDEPTHPAADEMLDELPASVEPPPAEPSPAVHEMTVERPDAGVELTADAGVEVPESEPVAKPPPKKPRVKKPPPRLVPKPPPAAPPPAPGAKPKPRCDPFANPKGCK